MFLSKEIDRYAERILEHEVPLKELLHVFHSKTSFPELSEPMVLYRQWLGPDLLHLPSSHLPLSHASINSIFLSEFADLGASGIQLQTFTCC